MAPPGRRPASAVLSTYSECQQAGRLFLARANFSCTRVVVYSSPWARAPLRCVLAHVAEPLSLAGIRILRRVAGRLHGFWLLDAVLLPGQAQQLLGKIMSSDEELGKL